ncbi:transposon protein, putative, CACTA, En/Spm sub-class, expressed [Cinnamomum micranthum f. kanehirae]|uniref:Transposon protein, putative, CACTA, En/Spm sub-class, expressed n=1 Tax=Cinnamomum micranthum f. kanehirae TaxID=337451 RepID=A0A443N9M8_9MAGN|nr:transposon protein, putative, CACTA, En/Spm sub-class, expressed [Cinnamomum micranthum f. kanehirae]
MTGNVGYYGVLKDVIELQYIGGNRIMLFKCDWWDVTNHGGRGIKQDEYGFTCVNFTRTLNTNEPFILANQAQQVFYVQDTNEPNWHVAIKIQPRDLYDMESEVDPCQQIEPDLHIESTDMVDTNDGVITWNRPDIEGVVLDANIVLPHQTQERELDDFIDDGEGDDTFIDNGDGDGDGISIDSEPARTEVGGIGSSSNPISGKKRTRGSSRGIKLFNRRPDDKLIVQFNAEGQPIGDNARPFATLCGIIVRTPGNAPLQVTKWADVPEQSKEKMWKHIQDYAVVDDERKKWVLQSLGKKYRDYRKDIKDKYYSPWNTDDERLQHRPPDVSSEDWAWLVQYWGSPEVQAVASKNKANRSSQKLRHTGGTKSFARHRDEETRSRTDGSIPTRADLFIRTHSRKDGTPVDEKSTEIISKFKELSAAQEGGSSSSIGDDIYTQVMGAERHGRVRGYGLGPTPTSVFGSTSRQSQAAFDELQTELSSMHEKLQQMEEWKKNQEEEKRQMEEWKKNQEEEKRQMEEWKKNQEEEKRAHLEEMKLMQAIIAEMRQRLSPHRRDPSEGGAN